ncbi:unnamed protein product [Prorocentrum cordatum]|uniref:Uncharacterized protein n=1 Tax=Prorocentrum cordatum TaxID=2364126 RepID=A0ABN9XY23_9DINO|nr:unnamed protein product [Polarella glacialis]
MVGQPCIAIRGVVDDRAKVQHARNLGTDANDGSRRRVSICAQRQTTARAQAVRLEGFRSAGRPVHGIQRGGPAAKTTRGTAVTGLAPAVAHQLRLPVARSFGPVARGASVGLRIASFGRFLSTGSMAINAGAVAPQWARAVWEGLPPRGIFRARLPDAAARLDHPRHPWPQAISPAGVALLTLGRCGRHFEGKAAVVNEAGARLDLLRAAPGPVARLAQEAARRASDCMALNGEATGVRDARRWVQPISWPALRPLLWGSARNWTKRQRNSFGAFGGNAHWCHERLQRHCLAARGPCKLCRARPARSSTGRTGAMPMPAAGARARRAKREGPVVVERLARGIFPDPQHLWNDIGCQQFDIHSTCLKLLPMALHRWQCAPGGPAATASGHLDLFVDGADTAAALSAAADTWTKRGAECNGVPMEAEELALALCDVAQEAARWSGELRAILADDGSKGCDDLGARPQGQPEGGAEVELVVGDGPSTEHAEASAEPAAVDGGGVGGAARSGPRAAPHQLKAAEAAAPGRPPQTLAARLRRGAYGAKCARNLAGARRGATATALQRQKARLADGRHSGHRQCRTLVLSRLRGPSSADLAARLVPRRPGACWPRFSAAHGLGEEDAEAAVHRRRQRRRAGATEECASDLEE